MINTQGAANSGANREEQDSYAAAPEEVRMVKAYCGDVLLSKSNCFALVPAVRIANILIGRGYSCSRVLGASILVYRKERQDEIIASITHNAIKNRNHHELMKDSELIEILKEKNVAISDL